MLHAYTQWKTEIDTGESKGIKKFTKIKKEI